MQYNAIHTIAAKVAIISKMQLRIGISNTSVSLTRCQTVGRGAGVNEAYLPVVSETCWENPDPCFLVDGSGGATHSSFGEHVPTNPNQWTLYPFSDFQSALWLQSVSWFLRDSHQENYSITKPKQISWDGVTIWKLRVKDGPCKPLGPVIKTGLTSKHSHFHI